MSLELGICSRCKATDAVTVSRKEAFCKNCFIRFISGKQRKHMSAEKFKVKFGDSVQRQTILLPLSFGSSSIVLFDILISLYDEQLRNPRAQLGFDLNVLHIDDSIINKYDHSYQEIIDNIKSSYDLSKYPIRFTKLDINSYFTDIEQITLLPDFTSYKYETSGTNHSVSDIFNSLPNRASKDDLRQVVFKNLIAKYSVENNIKSIIWGHNMTRLAEEVIALTVKGRGSEIHSQLSDGIEVFEGVEIENIHPLRDVSKGEIDTFIELRDISNLILNSSIDPSKFMNKQKTINEVVGAYYKVVDQDYDNIVSTVVKTGAKLAEPSNYLDRNCAICDGKIYGKPLEWLRDITCNGPVPPENEVEEESYKEWIDANLVSINSFEKAEKEQIDLCYGCAVTVDGVNKSTISWPNTRNSKQKILNEFVLHDDSDEEE